MTHLYERPLAARRVVHPRSAKSRGATNFSLSHTEVQNFFTNDHLKQVRTRTKYTCGRKYRHKLAPFTNLAFTPPCTSMLDSFWSIPPRRGCMSWGIRKRMHRWIIAQESATGGRVPCHFEELVPARDPTGEEGDKTHCAVDDTVEGSKEQMGGWVEQ